MTGIAGYILALALTINCTAYGRDDSQAVLLKCDDAEQSQLVIPLNQWPSQWHGPQLGWVYRLDQQGQPLSSFAEFARQQAIREQSLKEMRRWRTQPLGLPRKP